MIALYNGKVYSNESFNEAVLIDGKKIKAVGTNEEIKAMLGQDDDIIDVNGRVVLPGFIDSHAHGPLCLSQMAGKIDLYNADTEEGYLEIIEAFIRENPHKDMYSGMGWLNPAFEDAGPEKEALDKICGDKPVILRSGDGHSVWANSNAIAKACITEKTPDPEGGTIEKNPDGTVRGAFRDQAQELLLCLIPEPSVEEYEECIEAFQDIMAGYGHTSVFDPLVEINGNLHKAYRKMDAEGRLKIKFGIAYASDPEHPEESVRSYGSAEPVFGEKLIEGNFVKVFIDGVVEGGTAYLKEEYSNQQGYRGESLWKQETLNCFCAAVDKAGYDLHFHVIGDGAVAQLIDAMEYVKKQNGEKNRNSVAAHMQIVDPEDYEKLRGLDIRISSNPYWFVKAPGYYEDIELPFLGKRAETEYPMKTFFDMGLIVSAGSDYAVTPEPYPMSGIQLAMLRTMYDKDHNNPENVLNAPEKITLQQGIEAFTINGARTMGTDVITGSLEAGKCADLVVLEEDIFETAPEEYCHTSVFMTISDGKVVYKKED